MAVSGVEVLNNYSNIQISSSSTNMVLYAKGTVTTGTGITPTPQLIPGSSTYYQGDYSASVVGYTSPTNWPANGIWAFSCSQPIGLRSQGSISSPTSNTGQSGSFALACNGAAGTVVTWYYFCPCDMLTPATHGVGLQVFDESGALAYDSTYPPMVPYGGISYASPDTIDQLNYSLTYPAGRNYAVAFTGSVGSQRGTVSRGKLGSLDLYDIIYRPSCIGINGNVLTLRNIRASIALFVQSAGISGEYYLKSYAAGLVIDVTGL